MAVAPALLTTAFYGNTPVAWLIAFSTFLLALGGLRLLRVHGLERLHRLTAKRLPIAGIITDALKRTKPVVMVVIALYAATLPLTLSPQVEAAIRNAALIAFLLQTGLWVMAFLDLWLEAKKKKLMQSNPAAATSMGAVSFVLKAGLWACLLLLAMDNLGINITTLVAGLGIGGIAVALAVQKILGDLFAALAIVLDKPFVVGDFVNLGPDHMGTVEHIGLKTTRLRSLSGEQIILSNSDLLDSRVRNYGRMFERRLQVSFNVPYQTSRANLQKIPQLLRESIESQPRTRFDRAHFKAYGTGGLEFEYVYFVTVADYNVYMDTNQAINLHIHDAFEKNGISFIRPAASTTVEKLVA